MAFKMMIPVAFIVIVLLASNDVEAAIGINWGRQTAQPLIPSQVVDLLLQNGITNARVYSAGEDILQAFAGSGINLTISTDITKFNSMEDSRRWVQQKAEHFFPSNIRGVILGDYVFLKGLSDKTSLRNAINCLQNLQNALNEAGYGDQIKATFRTFVGDLKLNMTRPSEVEFRDETKEEMITTLRFLQENNAPFAIEMFPIADCVYYGYDPSFAFPDNKTTQVKDINGAVYTHCFEFIYDSVIWALKKVNASDLKVIVSQVGWPTDGYPGASSATAEHFYKGLLPLLASNKGTPMRPGLAIDTFIHSLTDENELPVTFAFVRHWGIYRSNGQPKYKMDLSGQGRDIYPVTVKGIQRMPNRWCMFNGNNIDVKKVNESFYYACMNSDCSSMAPGGSCSKLGSLNVSYAFNMYYQFHYQDEKACDFGGLGYVSVQDPSTEECVFPVEVVRPQQLNVMAIGKGHRQRPYCAIFAFLISILGTFLY